MGTCSQDPHQGSLRPSMLHPPTKRLSTNLQVCNDVNEPRQVCNDVPEEVCDNVAATVTKYVDDEQYSNIGSRKCAPATRQECNDVVEQVPRQTLETECKTEYVQECSQPRSGGYGN